MFYFLNACRSLVNRTIHPTETFRSSAVTRLGTLCIRLKKKPRLGTMYSLKNNQKRPLTYQKFNVQ